MKPFNVKSNNFFDWLPKYVEKALVSVAEGLY